MSFLKSSLSTKNSEYQENYKYHKNLNEKLNELQAEIKLGGEEKSRIRHKENG